jgi:HdeA/HdeB family
MRKVAVVAAAMMASAAMPAKAQVVLEMSAVTCEDYLKSNPEEQDILASWLSGYIIMPARTWRPWIFARPRRTLRLLQSTASPIRKNRL